MGRIIGFFLGLSPGLLAGVFGIGGASLAVAGFMLWNELIDNPYIRNFERARAEDACTIRTMEAANIAEAAERQRQQRASNAAIEAYRLALADREKASALAEEKFEQESADYEAELNATGRACILDLSDIDRLRGKQNVPASR